MKAPETEINRNKATNKAKKIKLVSIVDASKKPRVALYMPKGCEFEATEKIAEELIKKKFAKKL